MNVNDHTEKKQGLTYLSWAWAWSEALKADPDANYSVRMFEGKPYTEINGTAMVWVDVTLGKNTRTCWLPVMDHRNKPITGPDSFQINTALMRCLTKCLAMFGLGLYIYAGEDLPDTPKEEKVEEKVEEIDRQTHDNLTLFANSLVEYLDIAKTEKDLRGYWKANQGQIDELKALLPETFKYVQEKFTEAKQKMGEKQ